MPAGRRFLRRRLRLRPRHRDPGRGGPQGRRRPVSTEYLGFHTDISANLEIPAAPFRLKNATGRVDLTEREANWRKNDFELMENCMSEQEMAQECSRCLRCDHYGHAGFKGGRLVKW